MKLNIAHNRNLKAVTLTALASLCLVNCNGGDYGKIATNQAANQKAALLAEKAVSTATAAGLAGSWSCNQAQSEKLYSNSCYNRELMVISSDLGTLTQIMEIDEQSDGAATSASNESGSEADCYFTRVSELKLTDSNSSTDFSAALVYGEHTLSDVNGSAELDACQAAFADEKAQAAAQAAEKAKKHNKHDRVKAHTGSVVDIELSLQGANGENDELIVKITKKGKPTLTNVYNRVDPTFDPSAPAPIVSGMPNPLPSLPAEAMPNVVVTHPSLTSMGMPNPLPSLPAQVLPSVSVGQ
jgi:hypothetical protein